MKHLKHVSKTLAKKTPETLENHLQTYATFRQNT
jgi:hypothetical protein